MELLHALGSTTKTGRLLEDASMLFRLRITQIRMVSTHPMSSVLAFDQRR